MFVLRDLLCLCHTLLKESLQNGLLGEVRVRVKVSAMSEQICNASVAMSKVSRSEVKVSR